MNIFIKFKNIFKYLIVLNFSLIKKKKILIFSGLRDYEIKTICKYDFFRMYLPSEKLNFYILIKMIIFCKFKKIDYLSLIIKKVRPKIFISTYDNDFDMYILKKKFPNIKFILIQNGRRGGANDLFNSKFSKINNKKYFIDYFFVFGEAIKNQYKKFVVSNYFCSGSLRNNFFPINNKINLNNKIILISQFRPKFNLNYKYKNRDINYTQFYKNSKKLFINLEKFCNTSKIQLFILPSTLKNTIEFEKEKIYYNSISKSQNIKFIDKRDGQDSYKIFDRFDIFFGEDSTLLYEAISRNKKIGAFKRFKHIENYNFLWPMFNKKKGFFYSDEPSYSEIKRIHNNIIKISMSDWIKYIKDLKMNFMCFDLKNQKLRKLIKKELNTN